MIKIRSLKKEIIVCSILVAIYMMLGMSMAANTNSFTFSNSGITVLSSNSSGYEIKGNDLTINEPGTYTITGSAEEGSIKVKKETQNVTLILKDLTLSSSKTAPISLNKSTSTVITIQGNVTLKDNEDATTEDTNEDFEGAAIKVKSGGTLLINGNGTLNIDASNCKNGIKGGALTKITLDGTVNYKISSKKNAIACDNELIINNGTFDISAENDGIKAEPDEDDTESIAEITINGGKFKINASSDGIFANSKLTINGGDITATAEEGIESTSVVINGGTIDITSTDDGINASNKSSRYPVGVEINDGNITIKMSAGDTDAIDANGSLVINGGTINITGKSAFDYDSKAEYNGGTLIVNGETVTSISNQFGGGRGNFGGGRNFNTDGNTTEMEFNDRKMGRQGMNQNGGQMTPPDMSQNGGQMTPPDGKIPSGNVDKAWSKASSWAEEELKSANSKGLIPFTLFNKDYTKNITREQFAEIAVRLYEALTNTKSMATIKNPFKDVNNESVTKAYELGITTGTSSTEFTPNAEITREQMATMLTRALEKAGIDVSTSSKTKFTDEKDMHDWGKNAIYFMSGKGIIKGVSTSENRFDVNGKASIEQALIVASRSVEVFKK